MFFKNALYFDNLDKNCTGLPLPHPTPCCCFLSNSFVSTIFMIASCANVFNVRIFFQMRACVVMAEWRRCLNITTVHNLCMLRPSLRDRLFPVTAESVWKEWVVGTNLAFLVSRRSTPRVYRRYDPSKPHPTFHGLSSQFTMSLILKEDAGAGSKQALDYTAS